MAALRFDKFPSVYLFRPFARRTNRLSPGRVPILMYHSIRETRLSGWPYYETSTSPAVFACHVTFLSDHGYATITLGQATCALGRPHADKRPVVLTFDDGCRSFYNTAAPIMQSLYKKVRRRVGSILPFIDRKKAIARDPS
jgi:hypothetical protein